MKRYLLRVLPLMLVAAVAMASCSKKGGEGDVIPKEALFVANVNVASVWQKGDLAHAGNLQMVQGLRQQLGAQSPEMDRLVEAFLADPSSCGLALERDLTCFTASDNGSFAVVVSAWLKDKQEFNNFIEQLNAGAGLGIKTEQSHGLDITRFDNHLIAASDGKRVLFVSNDHSGSDDLAEYASSLFNLKKEASMSSVDNFAKYLTLSKDLGLFLPYENLMNLGGALAMNQMGSFLSKEDMQQLKKAAIYFTGSFEKGSIDIKSGCYDMPESLTALSNQAFSDELLSYLPEQSLIAFTCALNTTALVDYLRQIKDFDIDDEVGIEDLSLADLIEAFGGSMAFSFYGMQNGTPLLALALNVDDSEAVGDLLDAVGGIEHNEQVYTLDGLSLQVFVNDKVAVLSTDTELINNLAKGTTYQGLKAIAPKVRKSGYFYINLDLEQYPADLVSLIGLDNPVTSLIFSLFDYAECLTDGKTEGTAHIYMTDRETNSLAYLLQSVDKLN